MKLKANSVIVQSALYHVKVEKTICFLCLLSFNAGNNRITDIGWKSVCKSSPDLSHLHAADCPKMTDVSLKSIASLKNISYLDISDCVR